MVAATKPLWTSLSSRTSILSLNLTNLEEVIGCLLYIVTPLQSRAENCRLRSWAELKHNGIISTLLKIFSLDFRTEHAVGASKHGWVWIDRFYFFKVAEHPGFLHEHNVVVGTSQEFNDLWNSQVFVFWHRPLKSPYIYGQKFQGEFIRSWKVSA